MKAENFVNSDTYTTELTVRFYDVNASTFDELSGKRVEDEKVGAQIAEGEPLTWDIILPLP